MYIELQWSNGPLTLRPCAVHIDVLLQLPFVLMPIFGIDALRAHVLFLAVTIRAGRVVGEDQQTVYVATRVEIIGCGQIAYNPLGADHGRVVAMQKGALGHLLYDAKHLTLPDVLFALKEVHCRRIFLWMLDTLGDFRTLGIHQDAVCLLLVRRQPQMTAQRRHLLRLHDAFAQRLVGCGICDKGIDYT